MRNAIGSKPSVIILAAGRGVRMNSIMPKVLHKILDKPMLQYVVDSAARLNPFRIVIVVGRHYEEIKRSIDPASTKGRIRFAVQREPKGTGDALSKAGTFLKDFKGTILVLNGDVPLITAQTLGKFLRLHRKGKNDISFISFIAHDPSVYGRVLRNDSGNILSIIEEKDTIEAQKKITEVNSGIYAIESDALGLLKEILPNTLKGEYYLTDIVGIARKKGCNVGAYLIGSESEMMGVNTPSELLKAQQTFRRILIDKWINRGVMFLDPGSVFISGNVKIRSGAMIYHGVYIEGKTILGRDCIIHPNVHIIDSIIKDGVVIKDSTVIEGSTVRSKAVIGPFAHIRPGSDIGSEAKIGNFVEVKKSMIGKGTKASHLSYLGDASVGKDVNIGAGTITCNYDGREKHKTTIEDNVFIGSDTQFIAPVKIGRGAYVGAGSTITKYVPPMSLAISRTEQRNIKGWAAKKQSSVVSCQSSVRNKKSKAGKRKGG
ncbi:MAG: bifunctional UDP-N-acetylglucosamine diphosphorylase/glucosamine-1-phosphate N-acetyltransferase GlmU [Nitrospirae bacterium]|nr:bifunctional UDP-N-acetylglucosamine diphosphorylase/glucosamine-1-phosphate N-acetyltransferase GlmU [Nitrospirota bacterium]